MRTYKATFEKDLNNATLTDTTKTDLRVLQKKKLGGRRGWRESYPRDRE